MPAAMPAATRRRAHGVRDVHAHAAHAAYPVYAALADRVALAALAAVVGMAASCGPSADAVDDETRARVAAVAGPVTTELARTLSGELLGAMTDGGPAHAIDFCAREAEALTGRIAAGLGAGWEVKRTARRTRNPENGPDRLEARALERFHGAEWAEGGLEDHVQRTSAGDYRYYRPLRIAPLCMQCHGDPDAFDPAVRRVLAERYPNDRAVGYEEGELRGLIRVTVPASAVR